MLLDPRGKGTQPGQKFVRGNRYLIGIAGARWPGNRGHPHNQHAGPASSAGLTLSARRRGVEKSARRHSSSAPNWSMASRSPEGVVLSHPEFEGYEVVMGE